MEEKKPTLEDYARYSWIVMNPEMLDILLILYASEVLEKMEAERELETEG